VGVATTVTLWRSAGLAAPSLDTPRARRDGMLIGLVYMALVIVAFFVWEGMDLPLVEPALVLVALGVATGIVGLSGRTATDRTDRYMTALVGLALIVTAIAASAWAGDDPRRNYEVLNVVAPVASGVGFFGLGLVQLARG
ncbi:MAG TPA: hypothetical protein VGA36_05780, partial [Nitriliruptorales bacterium]